MQVERIIYPVTTLGPGNRIGIWTIGCTKRCKNCISPELRRPRPDKNISVSTLICFVRDIIENNTADGITISGGDPLEQPEDLLAFITGISGICSDILIYTGYTLPELEDLWSDIRMVTLRNHTAVLIDGRYIHEQNDGMSALTGSTNQQIHYFNSTLRPLYEEYLRSHGREVQNYYFKTNLVSVGIHPKEDQSGSI